MQKFVFLVIHCARESPGWRVSKAELVKKFTQQFFSALDSVSELTSVKFQALKFLKFLSSKKIGYQNRLWKLCLSCSGVVCWGGSCALTADAARSDAANFIFTWNSIWFLCKNTFVFFQLFWKTCESMRELNWIHYFSFTRTCFQKSDNILTSLPDLF